MPLILKILAAFFIAVAGGALSAMLAKTHRQLCAFISLGAGTLLAVALFGILPECLESLKVWQFLLAAASGYFLFALIARYIFHVCPACSASHFDEATTHRLTEFAMAMMIALAIHCTVDGLALAAGNQGGVHGGGKIDWSITFAICVHKFPEGLALGALLLGGGFSRSKMLLLVAAVEATTMLGGIIGYFWLEHASGFWLALALANAGGGFFYLAVHAVAGEILKHHKALVIGNFAAGFAAVSALILLLHLKA